MWRIRIKTYVDTFNGCMKDGTEGTRDYRSLSGLVILLMGICPQLLMIGSSILFNSKYETNGYVVAVFVSAIAFIIGFTQPYGEKMANAMTVGILIVSSLLFALGAQMYSQERETIKLITIFLLMVPHTVFWGYNGFIFAETAANYFKAKIIPNM